jgi:hypothetical protein
MIYKTESVEKSAEKIEKRTQFAEAFDENDKIDEIVRTKPKEEFPRLSLKIPRVTFTETRNYAKALEKSDKSETSIPTSRAITKTFPTNEKPLVANYEEPTSPRPNPIRRIVSKSWADWSSSEDEDDTECVDAW